MVRTGQMMLAKTLLRHCFSLDWLLATQSIYVYPKYRSILRLFADTNQDYAPFSLHNIIVQNVLLRGGIDHREVSYGGEWFSPTKIAKTLEFVVNAIKPEGIVMYVPPSGIIYIDRVSILCNNLKEKPSIPKYQNSTRPDIDPLILSFERNKISSVDGSFIHMSQSGIYPEPYTNENIPFIIPQSNYTHSNNSLDDWQPLFIMITTRVGLEKINPIYIPHLQHILRSKHSVGIIGGKPRESLYFIGYQGDYLIYLDPHLVQHYVNHEAELTIDDIETYHCKVPLKIPITNIDPSLAIGFYFKTCQDFMDFIADHQEFSQNHPVLFTIEENEPNYLQKEESEFTFLAVNK
jgi:cysteine protease ATG4